jgi:hypothetical protein
MQAKRRFMVQQLAVLDEWIAVEHEKKYYLECGRQNQQSQ